ncbi:hypothetical protein SLS60_009389 [Paraconiothyrium brasiliense]|uniref:Uncharacterized protein n=1 Tax=Paraconiothyrium brasiliense TaxID=300254 RepID=A0ABR3QU76_9PLEO
MTMIPYCFVDKRSYDRLNCKVRAAVKLWSDALGEFRDGKWGPENKHSLAFLPPSNLPRSQNFNPYCCNYYTYGEEGMKLDRMTELKFLGMAHEHQRWDRDDYVYFRCENVKGMKERVEYAHKLHGIPNGITTEEVWEFLCENYAQATFWEAPSIAWIRGDGYDDIDEAKSLDGPGGFDYDSIMMYGSAQGLAVPYLSQVTINTATLVKVKKNSSTGEKYIDRNDWWLPIPTRVSQQDAAFVRRFYPIPQLSLRV